MSDSDEVGGHVHGPHWSWDCTTCAAVGNEPTEHDATLALYLHRKTHDG
jgi:hypothetical protein